MADHAHAAGFERRARLPGREQVLDDREQLLLGRVPRLEQVVVERDLVDRRDRRLGVGVGGEQHPLGLGHDLARLHAGTRCPAIPGMRWSATSIATCSPRLRSSLQELERLGARAGAQDPVALAEAAAQVARDRRQHGRLVVDRQEHGPLGQWPLVGGRAHAGNATSRAALTTRNLDPRA